MLGVPTPYQGKTQQAFVRHLLTQDVRRNVLIDREPPSFEYQENCQVKAIGSVGQCERLEWSRLLATYNGRTKNDGCKNIKIEAARLYKTQTEEQESEDLPVLMYYGTGRLWAGKKASNKNQLKETKIVLVDEIDANIHPSWQKELLPNLIKHFANIQFVVTSHSPFILQSLSQGKIINLDHLDSPEQKADQWDRGVEDIVTQIMGVDTPRSAMYEAMMQTAKHYYALLDAGKPATDHEVQRLSEQLDAATRQAAEKLKRIRLS